MEYEVVSENIKSLFPDKQESVQMVVDTDIIVPDIKPDMDYIADCNIKAFITDENIFDGRISFRGKLDVQMIYYSAENNGRVCALKSTIPFEDFINVEGIVPEDYVCITPIVEHIEYRMTNSRKAFVKAIVSAKANIEKMMEESICVSCGDEEDICIKEKEITLKETVGIADETFKIVEDLHIPSSKGAIDDIVYIDANIVSSEMKAVDGGIKVSGNIKIDMVYVSSDDMGMVENVSFEVPIEGFVDCREAQNGNYVYGTAVIKNCIVDIFTDNEGNDRGISADMDIHIKAEVFRERRQKICQDAYSDKKYIDALSRKFRYPMFAGSNKNRMSIKETLKTNGKDILKLINSWGIISYCDVQADKNMAVVNGIVEVSMQCLSKDDDMPLTNINASLPFSQEVEMIGIDEDTFLCASANIDNIQFNILNSQEAEVVIYIGIDVCAQYVCEDICVEKIEECENKKNTPSAVIYVVQKGDTLWDIAKRYRTNIDNIVQINDIEKADEIYPGQKLLILKKVNL